MKARPAYILGNGPSLRGFAFAQNLRGKICFGMNLAFRYWHNIAWYPTYYSCLDEVVGMNHLGDIGNLIKQHQRYGIKGFCLRRKVIQALGCMDMPFVHDYESLLERYPFYFRSYWSTTGSKTLAWAAWLGYRNIILLGVDGNYVKYIKNSRHIDEVILTVDKTPAHNPNYFFDGYQQAGDLYHVPMQNNPAFPYEDQLMGWHMLLPQLQATHTRVVNANPQSAVDAFPKCAQKQARSFLHRMRRRDGNTAHPAFPRLPKGSALDILELAMQVHGQKTGSLLDVGSFHGQNSLKALKRGWQVCAAEPDEINAGILQRRLSPYSPVYIEREAVSCVGGRTYSWYRTNDGRWNAMQDMVGNGICTGATQTVTIRELAKRAGLKAIDILIVDVVGFEFMALRGVPFREMPPAIIIASWNDGLSLKLGYGMHDMAAFLLSQNYTVFASEWHPAPNPDTPGKWQRFVPYPMRPIHPHAWGHIIAFKVAPAPKKLARAMSGAKCDPALVQASTPILQPERIAHVIRF